MRNDLSIVIICKNEAQNIERVLQSIESISDDIIVYDSGSTDGTIEIIKKYKVKLYQGKWMGFGSTKKYATGLAQHDWILSLDADEAIDEKLHHQLKELHFSNERIVYDIRFKNFLGKKHLKWGEWGRDHHIRLFNRKKINWNDAAVHERLIFPENTIVKIIQGSVLHTTMKDTVEYSTKMVEYALLIAEKYFQQGKRATWFRCYMSPGFSFLKYYVFMLGFLDGWEGLVSARMTSFYTALKYARLHELWKEKMTDG